MFLDEKSKISFKRIYALVGVLVLLVYTGVDIYLEIIDNRRIDLPKYLAGVIFIIVTAYFGKAVVNRWSKNKEKEK